MDRLDGKRVLLGLGGSVAAYRALDLVRELRALGAEVKVAPTRAAQAFVTRLTFEAISGQPVMSDPLEVDRGRIPHIEEAYAAHLAIVAPATADLMAKMAHGFGDEALLATLLSYRGPLVVGPAMETRMWEHPATRANVALLEERGAVVVGPDAGPLASGRSGHGRLAPVSAFVEAALQALARQDLQGRRVLVTAGPTCEDLDPVRFLTNRSTGKMGVALARAAAHRGAEVALVHGPLDVEVPRVRGLEAVPVRSARDMFDACLERTVDVAILAAAVADYRPAQRSEQKLKKAPGPLSLDLARTDDILATLGERRAERGGPAVLVGFAAETEHVLDNARGKLVRKNADLICANDVTAPGSGFGTDTNRVTLVGKEAVHELPPLSKGDTADRILDEVVRLLGEGT